MGRDPGRGSLIRNNIIGSVHWHHFHEEGTLWGLAATVEVAGIARPEQHRTGGEGLMWHN